MSWINFFENKIELHHSFGRGTNADISPEEETLFNKSYIAFEEKKVLDAYEYFLNSLQNYTNSQMNNNIIIHKDEASINFELFQGTARVVGRITNEEFYAEVILVKKEQASVALKRYILERNYQLTYAYYFADNEYIKLKIFHNNTTMSPQKVFFPIRELALNADFDKEHIKSEFDNISLEDISHLSPLKSEELELKFKYLKKWIDDLEAKVITLPSNDSTGMQAFLYLNILFKIDYLLVPKYKIYQKISKKIQAYFSEENSTIEGKNEELKVYVSKLKEMSFEEFCSNFYEAKYTFNPTEKTSYEDVVNFINESLIKIRWYKNNRYNQIIPTIYRYIAFYSLYNYGLNQVQRNLLHLLIKIQTPDFFADLNYKVFYNAKDDSFSKRAIISEIDNIIEPQQSRFKLLKPFGNELNFSSMNEFSNSFYTQLKHLNFEEI
jgi:hypothetical protein